MKTIRWGIVGTGTIANRFAQACNNTPGAQLVAVASRNKKKGAFFAEKYNIPYSFGSYEEMAAFDGIDIAYIATPHGLHADNAILFMNHKKAVLSEKPITLNISELERMIAAAKENDVFLMEAMWARLVPGTKKLIEIVESGILGKIKGIQSTFSYDMTDEPEHHAFDPQYGGGSILDVGCYCLSFASWYANSEPEKILAVAELSEKGVDIHSCYLIKYKNGAIASLSSGMTVRKPNEGYLFGEKGYVYVERSYAPQEIEIHIEGKEVEKISCPYFGNGFEEQIMEASECLRQGKKESDIITHDQSRLIMHQMDELRRQIGVKYPVD
ncbi:MAG: Gfo/Idh/MocA family oxidoreductase [Clostridiales bacterium]|jgi:dihydrodiol dehydrogenase / D-xylose 1-dehydrogenase (NADP)|nr:Gfo/Idh/MocA family oxidoreductase [Clostridiales bacterium]